MLVSGIYVEVYTRCRLVDSFDSFLRCDKRQRNNGKTRKRLKASVPR